MEVELDSDGNSCPGCMDYIMSLDQPQFFTCGCVICDVCLDSIQQCPNHAADVYRGQDPVLTRKFTQAKEEYEKYEGAWNADRSTVNALVMQLRQYVRQKSAPQAYLELPEFTNICVNCHRKIEGVKCDCGFVNMSQVPSVVMVTKGGDAGVEMVECMHCGQRTTPATESFCYSCGKSLYSQVDGSQLWTCANCNYGYNQGVICQTCQTPKGQPQIQVQEPPKPISLPARQGSTLVWTCVCGYEYNLQTSLICIICRRSKTQANESPIAESGNAKWKCAGCGFDNLPSSVNCTHCRNPKEQPAARPVPQQSRQSGSSTWACACGYEYNLQGNCVHCNRSKPQANESPIAESDKAKWKCVKCHRENQPLAATCNYCKAPRKLPGTISVPSTGPRRRRN